MENHLRHEIDEITAGLRKDPAHIRRWLEKEAELKKTPELFLSHKTFFTEDFVFEPDEDIMIYADFNYPYPPPLPGEPPEFGEWTMHRHEFFEMFYVYSGVCECYYEDRKFTLPPGSLCLLNTRCRHKIHNIGDESLIYNIMVRRQSFTSDMLGMLKENDLFLSFFLDSIHGDNSHPNVMLFSLTPGESAELYLFSLIREYYRGEAGGQSLMKLLYASLLIELSRKYKNTPESGPTELGRIMAYISDNWNRVSLKSLSEALHYSQSYLSRFIQKYTGQSFSDYVRGYRLERAAHLLIRTELGVEKIAELCGYSQRSSFEKEFKKYTGKTPREYRLNP